MIYLSIIIPVYNNSDVLIDNLPYLLNYLSWKKYEYEIIIVDDGSNDKEKVEEISTKFKCVYLRNNVNSGKGYAIKTGMENSCGVYRIFTDADIPYGKEDFDKIIFSLDTEKYDVVIGDRSINKSSNDKDVSYLRSFGSKLFSFLVGGITSDKFGDTQCGLKGFTSEAAKELFGRVRTKGFAIDVELLYLALKRNLKIFKIPVKLRKQGISTVRIFKHGILMLIDLIKIKIYQLSRKYEQ